MFLLQCPYCKNRAEQEIFMVHSDTIYCVGTALKPHDRTRMDVIQTGEPA